MAGTKRAIKTDKAAPPGAHYSQAIVAGDHVYVSGSGPFEPVTHKLVEGDIAVQTRATIRNIAAILEAAGAALAVAGMRPAGRLLVMNAIAYTGRRG